MNLIDSFQSAVSDFDAMIRSALLVILSDAGCNEMHWRKTANLTRLKNMSHVLAVSKMFVEASDDFHQPSLKQLEMYLVVVNKLSLTVEKNVTEVPNPNSP